LYYTADGGDHWQVIHEARGLSWITPVSPRARAFYVCSESGVWFTSNGRELKLLEGSPKPCTWVAVDPLFPERIYATAWRSAEYGGLWRYESGKWTRLRDDRYISRVAVCPTNPRRLVVSTSDHPYHDICFATGVWVSSDGGTSWSQQNDGLACLRGDVIAFNPHDSTQLVFGTLGRGFFVGRWR
jgi:hypothetical protein